MSFNGDTVLYGTVILHAVLIGLLKVVDVRHCGLIILTLLTRCSVGVYHLTMLQTGVVCTYRPVYV